MEPPPRKRPRHRRAARSAKQFVKLLHRRLDDVFAATRRLLFVLIRDERAVRSAWWILSSKRNKFSWHVLLCLKNVEDSIPAVSLDQCQRYFSDPNVQHHILKRHYSQQLISMLEVLLIYAALRSFNALTPLFDKLPDGVEAQLTALFDERYLHEIATFRPPAPLPTVLAHTWFSAEAFSAEDPIPTDFADLHNFPGVAERSIDADLHRRNVEAYGRREARLARQQELTGRL